MTQADQFKEDMKAAIKRENERDANRTADLITNIEQVVKRRAAK